MAHVGRQVLGAAAGRGECSFATVDAVADRWAQFASFAKAQGIGRMERVSSQLVREYGLSLAKRVDAAEISPAYAKNLVSAVNTVMGLVRPWRSVSPTKDCGIPTRSTIRHVAPAALDRSTFDGIIEGMTQNGLTRQSALASLARNFGLRSKEASLLDAAVALRQAQQWNTIQIKDGTKGGRLREVPITMPFQIKTLADAAQVQSGARSMVPVAETWSQWRNGGLREGREALKQQGCPGYHDLRAGYACERYSMLTGFFAPVCQEGGRPERDVDYAARMVISRELGHDRVDVVASYIGAF
jgi:hypothetical protein